MGKGKGKAAEPQSTIYRRARTVNVALSQLCGASQMCFYMLMTYATYIGNSNFGILVAVTGVIVTASRVFDSITDPVCAFICEHFSPKTGKIRTFLLTGWAFMALGTTLMCNIGAGHFSGIAGIVFFVICYMIYIVGYTFSGIAGSMTGPVLTNDPKQRPTVSVWSTVYSYCAPMVISMVSMLLILPKYDSQITTPFLAEYNIYVIVLALVFMILACVGVAPYDKPENFAGIRTSDGDAPASEADKGNSMSVRDMFELIRDNKELQRYMIAACSDKLAQTIGSASVISTMLYGILIGNLSISTVISSVAMFPSILFAIVGARLAGKKGNKNVMITWTWACIILNVIFAMFLLFSDTTQITVAILPTVIFIVLTFGNSAFKMVVSTATGALRMDIVDYELYRTGRYMPASVSATYSFVDKLISSFGATVATLMIGIVGYTTTTPQMGDPLTLGVRIITVLMYCGFPIIGWICTIIGMRNSELTKERMAEVQTAIAERKAKAQG